MSPKTQKLLAIALFWLLSAAFFWQTLFGGKLLLPTSHQEWPPWSAAVSAAEREAITSNLLMSDSVILTYPWRMYNHRMFHRGEIPFWNPWIFAGYPHLAALQSHALYPLTLVFDLWDPIGGIAYSMAIHLALAGSLMFYFLRRQGLGWAAATLGGVMFEFNGFFMVRMSAPSYIFSGIWTPFFLVGVRDLLARSERRPSWKVVVATFAAFLGGHPQIFILMLAVGFGYALFTAWPDLKNPAKRRRLTFAFLLLCGSVLLGLAVAGIQLLPFVELVQQTARSPFPYSAYQQLALPILVLAQAVVPDVFGHPVDGNSWIGTTNALVHVLQVERIWRWNYSGENLFTGVVPLLLALLAMLRLRHRESLYFGALCSLGLLVLFGAPGVLRAFYELVPTFKYSRSDRIIYIYMFSLCVLAALGYEQVTAKGIGKRAPKAMVWLGRSLVALPMAPALFGLLFISDLRAGYRGFLNVTWKHLEVNAGALIPEVVEAAVIAILMAGALVLLRRSKAASSWLFILPLLLVVAQLFRFGWRFNPTQEPPLFPKTEAIAGVQEETDGLNRIVRIRSNFLPANTAQLFDIFDVNGASAAALDGYARLMEAAGPNALRKDKYFRFYPDDRVLESHLLDFLNVELIFSSYELALPKLDHLGHRVYRNPNRLPRFFLIDQVETYATKEEGIGRLLSPDFDFRRIALVSSAAAGSLRSVSGGSTENDSVRVISYGAHEIEIEVQTSGKKLLVSSEVDYPGWGVFIDGKSVEKVLVNTAFRGAVVPSGTHRVCFRYTPWSFYYGIAVSLMGCALFVLSLAKTRRPLPMRENLAGPSNSFGSMT